MGDDEPKGRAKGGLARAAKLPAKRRSEIARMGALAKAGRLVRATHGGVLAIGDIKIPCYVLEDGRRVLAQRGLQGGVGLSEGGGKSGARKLAQVMAYLEKKGIDVRDLVARANDPIRFLPPHGGPQADGYEATILPDMCAVIVDAGERGKLHARQLHLAKRCDALREGFAKLGIIALVDEATGFQDVRPADALQRYLEMIVRKELAAWSKKFPDEFYENIYKLNNWPWPGMSKNRYSVVAHYTRDLIYERLAPGLLEELERHEPPDQKGRRKHKLHQWLTEDIGNPMLAQHMYSVVNFQRLAIKSGYGYKRFVRMVDKVLPRKGDTLPLALPEPDDP